MNFLLSFAVLVFAQSEEYRGLTPDQVGCVEKCNNISLTPAEQNSACKADCVDVPNDRTFATAIDCNSLCQKDKDPAKCAKDCLYDEVNSANLGEENKKPTSEIGSPVSDTTPGSNPATFPAASPEKPSSGMIPNEALILVPSLILLSGAAFSLL